MLQKLRVASFILLATTAPVLAQDRVALVIGNTAYQSLAPLPDAADAAQIMADGLAALGFDVNLVINANLRFQRFSIQQHLAALQTAAPGTIGVVYYQGHGVSVGGGNYLLPPNTIAADEDDVVRTSIDLASLLAASPDGQSVVVADCCAANPFDPATGMTDQGLVEMTAPDGVLLAFAAPAGEIAPADGAFAQRLMDGISVPGAAMQDVIAAAGPAFISAGNAAPIILAASEEQTAEAAAWNAIKDTMNSDDVLEFLETYPDGVYAGQAQTLIVEILERELEAAATEAAQAEAVAAEANVAEGEANTSGEEAVVTEEPESAEPTEQADVADTDRAEPTEEPALDATESEPSEPAEDEAEALAPEETPAPANE